MLPLSLIYCIIVLVSTEYFMHSDPQTVCFDVSEEFPVRIVKDIESDSRGC